MLFTIIVTIISTLQSSSDTIEVKGTTGLSYRVFVNQDKLCFQYKFSRNWSEATKLDSGDISTPSITIALGDYFHVVWKKKNRIYYRTTTRPVYPDDIRQGIPPVWSIIDRVSTERTEPASNPFVEAQGEWIYVVWRGPYDQNNLTGEIWQRTGRIQPGNIPLWRDPVNKSRTIYKN